MKRKIVGAVVAVAALVGISSSASAQDGRRFNWSGVYFGAGIGSVASQTDWNYINNGAALSQSSSDAIVALHAGYQHQFLGGLVIGAEMGYGRTLGTNFGSATCPNPAFNCQTRVDDFFTVGGKVGFAMDNLLLYATGGYAQANAFSQATATTGGSVIEVFSAKHGGTYLGGGFDYALTKSFSVGVDYKRIDLNKELHCSSSAACETSAVSRAIDPVSDVVMARFSYKFGLLK